MMVQTSVRVILARFNARKFEAKVARQELSSLLDHANGVERDKLVNLIKVFRRPGFHTREFRAALAEFQSSSSTEQEVTS